MYVFGHHSVREALSAGREIERIWIEFTASGSAINDIRELARQRGITVSTADSKKFVYLAREAGAHKSAAQHVVALLRGANVVELEELIEHVEQLDSPCLALLDGISDPHNLGAIARSAECAGFGGLVVSEQQSAPITSAAVKVSAGALTRIPVAKVPVASIAARILSERGWNIVGAEADGDTLYSDPAAWPPKTAIIVGSEGDGLHPSVRARCSTVVSIPMSGGISSLNASVAASLLFFEFRRNHPRG